METREKQVFFSHDTGGIGSVCVHPSKNYFAVAEKGEKPNIIIVEFPSLKLYRVLKRGTEISYSNVMFSPSGDKLASLGGFPDYLLTVWDWRQEKIILKAKAFSQEIFRVSFSPTTDEQLITSGTGHIRFWKMARTFTGLKLQGEIGKFGQLELSDVSGFAELPDGKVICGTEYGTLILWEGNLVKAQLTQDEGKPLHQGGIEVVILEEGFVITAGADGYIRWWDFEQVDNAEPDEGLDIVITPLKDIKVQSPDGEVRYIVYIYIGYIYCKHDQRRRPLAPGRRQRKNLETTITLP